MKAKKGGSEFDKLGRQITDVSRQVEKLAVFTKEEFEDVHKEFEDVHKEFADIHKEMKGLATKDEMATGFAAINRRLDTIIQIQLDQHAGRIKKLETAVFS